MDSVKDVETEHAYVNVLQKGDFSSLKWIEGPLKSGEEVLDPEEFLVYVSF